MSELTDNEIIENWESEFLEYENQLHQDVRRTQQNANNIANFTIWLGGPGSDNPLFRLRDLTRKFLENRGYEVMISEECPEGADIASKEIQEIFSHKIVFIIAISVGSCAECIEFAYQKIPEKLNIYFPEEYQESYVFRSLFGKHSLIREESLFSLENFKNFHSELPHKILKRIRAYLFDQFRMLNYNN